MTDRALEELAARVEALQGPSREVDAEIAYAIGAIKEYREPMDRFGVMIGVEDASGRQNSLYAPWWPRDSKDRRGDFEYIAEIAGVPNHTASIDAARTLVSEDWTITIEIYEGGADVTLADDRVCPKRLPDVRGEAATPALALTAACLRAIASTPEQQEREG